MALTNTQIEKKLRQHDNEIVTIYDMLTQIQRTQDQHSRDLAGLKTDVALLKQGMTEILRRLPDAS